MSRQVRRTNERGFVATEFVMGLGLLLLPVALLVMVLPTWSERKEMAQVAAREAARIYVLTGDARKASAVVAQIESNYALKDDTLTLNLDGDPRQRGGEVTATVTTKAPLTKIPIMNANAEAIEFTQTHTEIVDLYRSFPL